MREATRARPTLAAGALQGRLKLKHLELFRHVCELQTLRKAADTSSMTQPAATKLIQDLEDMLGVQLFERDRRGMKLTQYGVVVRRHIAILQADIGNMTREVEAVADGASGHIRLGILPSLASELLARSVERTIVQWPRVRFSMQEGATTELLASLARNDLDLCFGRVLDATQAKSLRVMNVYTESFAIVCGTASPLARRRKVGWDELARGRWVLPAAGTPLRELTDNLFTRQGVLRPEVAVESSSFEKMRHVIARTSLLGVLPRSIALQGKVARDLMLLGPELSGDFSPISLLFRSEVEQPPLVEHFAEIVRESAAQLKLRVA
ncbi:MULTISPECIES: LysR substrate-binding domain-containing protein [unclassified Variovorax]|uniref:LysR substrate-binding domain-containing protein n=1 Tax=unclassified Variovorax TaxID=663243 RepID=UPI001BD4C43B|nr:MULTISPECIES: LysR substrate-binding domain-containing protein [unclassified Variovorax]